MGQSKYSFSKEEKLVSKKQIEELFKKGSSFYFSDFRVRYLKADAAAQHTQLVISVPKRNFKRAVDRNLLKRRIREAYRLNKHALLDDAPDRYYLAFIYLSKEILTFHDIQHQLIGALQRLKDNLQKKP